ncbi:hypothetical protein CIPAW_03G186000 [Carya illinoinensis]|uniref:Uncharacterized protein n=1 Tax=Carya illinoinensis TaxID=32201 RepID=A0A8T1R3X1_CARIL|nr:hypothetical protein CIPAW_03G186000 [Carya illinoinensis]
MKSALKSYIYIYIYFNVVIASSSSSPCPCFLQILGFALADNSKYTLHPQLLHSFLLRPPSYSVAIAFPFSSSFDRLLQEDRSSLRVLFLLWMK